METFCCEHWTAPVRQVEPVSHQKFPTHPHDDSTCCWWFRNPVNSPVEVGSLSHYLQGFSTIPGSCLGFLNHQQYQVVHTPGLYFGGSGLRSVNFSQDASWHLGKWRLKLQWPERDSTKTADSLVSERPTDPGQIFTNWDGQGFQTFSDFIGFPNNRYIFFVKRNALMSH